MADLIIVHIDSALDDVELLVNASFGGVYGFMLLRLRLRNLKKFVQICGKELGSEGSLTALLVRIEETVCRNAERILPHCQGPTTDFHVHLAREFECDIISMDEKIDGWYCSRQSSTSCTPDDVLEIISSIFEGLADVRSVRDLLGSYGNLPETIEALEEELSFMKRLISYLATKIRDSIRDSLAPTEFITTNTAYLLFSCGSWELATDIGVESIRDMLALCESVTINVAYLLFTFGSWEDFESKISIFLQKLEPVYETYGRGLSSLKAQRSLTQDMDDDVFIAMEDFVDSLISNLWDLLRLGTWQPTLTKDLQELYGGLRSFRTTLKHSNNLSTTIMGDIEDVACDAGVFICSLHHTQGDVELGVLKNLLDTINSFLAEIGDNETDVPMLNVLKMSPAGKKQHTEVKRMPSLGPPPEEDEVVGFHEEERQIVDQLTRGSKQLQIVSIVGMAGLGKTTLASKVYNNPSVSFHFHVRALCPVSQVVDRKKVLLSLLNQIDPSKRSQTFTEDDLADALRKSLKRRKYLIFLDDMWDIAALNSLQESFPNDNVGSRIVLTSRQHDVAPFDLLVDGKPYFLSQLNEETSLELLKMKLSGRLSLDLGMKIAEKCRGLPLMIVVVAGILKHAETEDWDELLDCLRDASITEQFRNTLELSYKHLPDYLRPCLLYFGTFRENREVSVRRVLRYWIAEGFIQGIDKNAAEHCLNDLIRRSLIMIAKQRSIGGVKACRVHDLIQEFCFQKAKDEHFFHFLRGGNELSAFNEPHNLQRLCIHSEAEHFKQSKLFCPRARSLILNSSESTQTFIEGIGWRYISDTFPIFTGLRVLDLEHVHFGNRFPSEIQQLVQLTFLAILSDARAIPSWIGNLSNLETLIVQGDASGQFPDSLWNLQRLQYLYVGGNGYYSLPEENLDGPFTLHELDRISGVVIPYGKMESLVRKFPNIRRLKCRLQYSRDDSNSLVFPNILSQIQSLTVLHVNYDEAMSTIRADELSFPANLKKLTLGRFSLSSRSISVIGELPNLEVLKLLWIRFDGETWEMKEGEFSKLKFLKLVGMKLVRWYADDDQLDSLRKLVLENCSTLEEVPSCLDSIPTLEVIEVFNCHYTVTDMVREIEKRREDLMGDPSVKIIINNISAF